MLRNLFIICFVLMGTSAAWALSFDHQLHQGYLPGEDCTTCHTPGAPSIVPALSACVSCHDQDFVDSVTIPGTKTHGVTWALSHGDDARRPAANCASCHAQNDCLECHTAGFADEQGAFGNGFLNVHSSDFHVTHPLAARADNNLCYTCHDNRYCLDCHDQFRAEDLTLDSHRKGFSSLTVTEVGPAHSQFTDSQCQSCHIDSVLPAHEWSRNHAREARKNLATCQACHPEGDTCLKCHSARSGLMVNPHPKDWDDISDRLKEASGGRTCRKCH